MIGDLLASGEPDSFVLLSVLDELPKAVDATRTTNDAAVEANRHHLGRAGDAFAVQLVEAGDQVCEIGWEMTRRRSVKMGWVLRK